MTKKEIIIKAWMDLNIETPFGICDKTGWVHGYFCNGVNDIEAEYGAEITDLIDYDIDMSGVGKFRPKSLRGIENNNGWIKIETVNDFPIENIQCYVINNIGRIQFAEFELENQRFYVDNQKMYPTHYYPIVRPDFPLY